ncbi:MAG: hypothetical protein E7J38_08095, partial [Streptococcus salivarius]|nr:hypothetical protein [Streptococcus salivarius]
IRQTSLEEASSPWPPIPVNFHKVTSLYDFYSITINFTKKIKSFQELTKNPLVNAKMENMSKIIDTSI